MKIAREFGLGLALASLAVAGAAQAETRSSSAIPSYTPASTQDITRGSAAAATEEEMRGETSGASIVLLVLAIAAILAGILIAVGGSDSPG